MKRLDHTPEPWKLHRDDVGDDEDAIIVPTGIRGPNGERIVDSEGGLYTRDDRSVDRIEADIRLIHAAPRMYRFITLLASNGHGPAAKLLTAINDTRKAFR